MTRHLAISLYLAAAAVAVHAQTATPAFASQTPAELAIRKAQTEIAKAPGHFPNYNSLAMAYARRERETVDAAWYDKADETLKKSFALQADNYEGLKVKAYILLGRGEYEKSLEITRKLNKQTPDDVSVYGYIADAEVELGNYKQAVESAQWMLNLRPGNTPALIRAGFLREVYGDLDGAMEVLRMAFDATPFQENEERAWLLARMAHVKLMSNDAKSAEEFAGKALETFPNYHLGLEQLGRTRMAQARYADAVTLFRKLYAVSALPENLFLVGEALSKYGDANAAAKTFAEFEAQAWKQTASVENANRELIAYYNDYAKDPAKALKLAQTEASRRHDVYTLDGYAWALAANGNYAQAQVEMQKALVTGIKDPQILAHAGVIAQHAEPSR